MLVSHTVYVLVTELGSSGSAASAISLAPDNAFTAVSLCLVQCLLSSVSQSTCAVLQLVGA